MRLREGGDEVGEEIEPEAEPGEEAGFVAEAIAEELERFVAVARAELRGVEAQEQGVELLRHNPPERFCWRGRRGGGGESIGFGAGEFASGGGKAVVAAALGVGGVVVAGGSTSSMSFSSRRVWTEL